MQRKKSAYPFYKKAHWTDNQKLEACSSYVMLGNLKEVALVTSIPYDTLKMWKTQQWWKDLMLQIRDEDIQQLDSNLQKVIGKALKAVEDRLDSGDYQYDPKTGKPIRIPVKAHVALKITTDLLTKQERAREAPVKLEVEKTIDARLAKLADEFMRFAKAKQVNVINNTTGEVVPSLGTIVPNLSTPE